MAHHFPTTPRRPRRRLVIVGNGMVAHRLCQRLAAHGSTDWLSVTVLGEEPYPAYDRIRLSETPSPPIEKLLLVRSNWYDSCQI